jgi:hypothetical protein
MTDKYVRFFVEKDKFYFRGRSLAKARDDNPLGDNKGEMAIC